MSNQAKTWLGFAACIAGVAAIMAGISALSSGSGFSTSLLYAAVGLATVSASSIGSGLLYSKWKSAPVFWYLGYFFIILPICLTIAFAVLDDLIGQY